MFFLETNSINCCCLVSLQLTELIARFAVLDPVFVIIDVRPDVLGLPTSAYEVVEEVQGEGKEIQKVFKHLPSSIDAEEAEGVSLGRSVEAWNTSRAVVRNQSNPIQSNPPLMFCTTR